MNANEDLRREMEAHLNNQQATNVGDITEAQVVESRGEEDEDTLLEAMTRAVNPQYLGDDGTQPTTPGSPPNMGLNWGPGGDDELTRWFNQGI